MQTKMQPPSLLICKDSYIWDLEDDLKQFLILVFNMASGYIKIKFDTKIKPPILPICGDSYEEDLNFHFGR